MAYKQLILPEPEKLSTDRAMAIIYRPKDEMFGVKMGQFLMQRKDATYYPEFAGKLTFFGTQVYQKNETIEEALLRSGTEVLDGEIPEKALLRSGTKLRKEETARSALARRLHKEIPVVADKILGKTWQWQGHHLPRQQIPGEYYCDIFVRIVRDFKEMEDILYGVRGKGTKQGIPETLAREEVERMIRTSDDDFMMGAGIAAKDFLTALDAGVFDHL